jgi:TRAP-type uncharacterized transport system substrate-binding protein
MTGNSIRGYGELEREPRPPGVPTFGIQAPRVTSARQSEALPYAVATAVIENFARLPALAPRTLSR